LDRHVNFCGTSSVTGKSGYWLQFYFDEVAKVNGGIQNEESKDEGENERA
jgi:hypothetical protein